MQNLVRGSVQTASVGEDKMSRNEEVGEIVSGDVAGDGLVVASGARVVQYGFVVAGVYPDKFESSGAEGGVCGAEVCEVGVGFGGSFNAGEVERGSGVVSPADSNDGASGEGGGGEHVGVRWRRCAGCQVGADVHNCAFE